MKIFEKIKQARKELGLTQSDMAKALGLSQNAVSKLESGQKKFIPNSYILFLYEKGFDINSIFNDKLPLGKLQIGTTPESQYNNGSSRKGLNPLIDDFASSDDNSEHPLEKLLLLAWEKKYLNKFNSLVRQMEINEEELFEHAPDRIAEAIKKLEDTDESQNIA